MQNHNRDMEYERENYGEDLYDDGYDDDEGHEEDEPAEPIIDRSTPAGKLMYNLYKRENDRKKLINIGKAHAPKPRAEPRPIQAPPQPVPKKKGVAVPKFRPKSNYEFHPIDFVQGKRREASVLAATNNYEDEVAPSMGHIRSNDDRKMCLQKVFELGQDCPQVYRGGAKVKREPKAKPRRKNPHSEHLAELVAGLDERQNFLQEMESAGMGEKYEAQMKGEIAQCLREISDLEAQSSAWEAGDADL